MEKINVEESEISESDLQNADEVFLTNVISGMRWVKSFRNKSYSNLQTKRIYKEIIQTISG